MARHRIYLVRHAKAEPLATDDHSRRLTPEGRVRFDRLVGALSPRLEVSKILTSPLVRARQTAEILARATGAPLEEDPRLAAGEPDARELLAIARLEPHGTALVGHNPELAEAITRVAGKELEVKPGSIAAIDVAGDKEHLVWLKVPRK